MSLGKLKFADGREAELVEIMSDCIVIERKLSDGSSKQFRLKKSAPSYEQVEEQVEELAAKNLPHYEMVEEPVEDTTDEKAEKAPAKAEKAEKVEKALAKEPKKVEKVKAEKTSKVSEKAKAPKKEKPADVYKDLYDWEADDGFEKLYLDFINNTKNANEAATYLFTKEGKELDAIIVLFYAEKLLTTTEVNNLSVKDLKEVADKTSKRVKETDYKKIAELLGKLVKGDNSKLIPEIVAVTAKEDEKGVFCLFDKVATDLYQGALNKRVWGGLVEIADKIVDKLMK